MAHPKEHSKSSAKKFGSEFKNSDGKIVYTRYVGEQHVKEDCNNYIPTAKEWVDGISGAKRPLWMLKTMKLEIED